MKEAGCEDYELGQEAGKVDKVSVRLITARNGGTTAWVD